MVKKFQFTSRANDEVRKEVKYYEKQKEGLGFEFLGEINQKMEQVSENPLSHSIVFDNVRRFSLKRFPFFVYYAIKEPIILILSIWHKKRETHPKFDNK